MNLFFIYNEINRFGIECCRSLSNVLDPFTLENGFLSLSTVVLIFHPHVDFNKIRKKLIKKNSLRVSTVNCLHIIY